MIRLHYGFQSTGGHFLDVADIRLQAGERPEDLYQRLMAFFEDSLLTVDCGVTRHGEALRADKDLTSTLENTIVVLWLQLIDPALPHLVKQKYGAELRNKSIASLALPSLFGELRGIADTCAMRAAGSSLAGNDFPRRGRYRQQRNKLCVLYKTAGRPGFTSHNLSGCNHLPEADNKYMARSRFVGDMDEEYDEADAESGAYVSGPTDGMPSALIDNMSVRRVDVIQSPYLNTYYYQYPVRELEGGGTGGGGGDHVH